MKDSHAEWIALNCNWVGWRSSQQRLAIVFYDILVSGFSSKVFVLTFFVVLSFQITQLTVLQQRILPSIQTETIKYTFRSLQPINILLNAESWAKKSLQTSRTLCICWENFVILWVRRSEFVWMFSATCAVVCMLPHVTEEKDWMLCRYEKSVRNYKLHVFFFWEISYLNFVEG